MLSALHEAIREPNASYISPQRLAKALDTTVTHLSQTIGVHRNTLRNPGSEALQRRLREIARIVGRLEVMLGTRDKAVYWLKNQPIQDLGDRTAWSFIEEDRADVITMLLEDFDNGANG
jgi:hypothetical protein